jgi:type II secretory pathway component HofQ
LGENFSIVTEYTSFLVLENDAEYERWKIERRNLGRLERDRSAQRRRQEALEALRSKAMQGVGPQSLSAKASPRPAVAPKPVASPAAQPSQPPRQPTASPTPDRRQSRDFNFGSGPVGPLFVGLAMLMRRRKKRK